MKNTNKENLAGKEKTIVERKGRYIYHTSKLCGGRHDFIRQGKDQECCGNGTSGSFSVPGAYDASGREPHKDLRWGDCAAAGGYLFSFGSTRRKPVLIYLSFLLLSEKEASFERTYGKRPSGEEQKT